MKNQKKRLFQGRLVKIPIGGEVFFNFILKDKSVIDLKKIMQMACKNGLRNKQNSFAYQQQIECILLKLWLMDPQSSEKFIEFVKHMYDECSPFSLPEREFLFQALMRMEWTRELIVTRFTSIHFEQTGETILPRPLKVVQV